MDDLAAEDSVVSVDKHDQRHVQDESQGE